MRMKQLAALAVWALLGWGIAVRGGFTFSFLFYTFSLIVIYGWLIRWIGLRGVRATRVVTSLDGAEPADGTFTAGDEVLVTVTMRRRTALPIPWLIAREQIGEVEHVRLHGPWFSTRATYRYVLPLSSRGVFEFEPLELWAGDPFGIVQQRVRARSDRSEAAAAPVPRQLGYDAQQALLSLGTGRQGNNRRGGEDFTEFRTYRDGDPLTRVMWKLAARTDDWFVRLQEQERAGEETAVVVIASGDDAAVDRCAAAAAGAITALGTRRIRFRLYTADGTGGRWRRRLAALVAAPEFATAELPPGKEPVVVVCGELKSEIAAMCRKWRASGREVLLLACPARGDIPAELAAWLGHGGVKMLLADEAGERTVEGGDLAYGKRVPFSS